MYQNWGADVVGMTLVPECVLAREAEICYASIAMVTDYDVWKDHPVCVDDVVKTMKANIQNVKQIITETIKKVPKEKECQCGIALKSALV
jgi:5'-methylthioadenosine phosphorylase